MRKVVAYYLMSLDGVAEDPDSFVHEWDDVLDSNLATVIASQDAVVLGRTSYTEWSRFWPTSTLEPFSPFINRVAKYVATSSTEPLFPTWNNSIPVTTDIAEFVRALKAERGGDIGVHASLSVFRGLMNAGVVDELHLVVAPQIAGRGRRLFDGLTTVPLSMLSSEVTDRGYWIAGFRVLP